MNYRAGEVIEIVKYDAPRPMDTANRLYIHDIIEHEGGNVWYASVISREYRVAKGVVPEAERPSAFVTFDDQPGLRIAAFTKLLSGRTLALVGGVEDGRMSLQFVLNWTSDLPGHWSRKSLNGAKWPSRDEMIRRAMKVAGWYRSWAIAGAVPVDLKMALNAKAAGL